MKARSRGSKEIFHCGPYQSTNHIRDLELKIKSMKFYKMVCQANEKVLHTKKKGGGGSFWLPQFVSEISSIFCILIEIEGKVFYDHARAFPMLTVVTCDSTHVELPASVNTGDVCTASCVTVYLKFKIYKHITWPGSGPFRAFAGSVKVSSFP
jgi:hypothetical protein